MALYRNLDDDSMDKNAKLTGVSESSRYPDIRKETAE